MTAPSLTPTTPDSYRWTVLLVAVLAQASASFVSQGMYTLVPYFKIAFQLSQTAAASAISALNGGQILTMFLMGIAIDRYGERMVVASAMLVMSSAAMLAAWFASGYGSLLVCLALLGGSYAAVQPGGTRAILRWFPPTERGMATGIRQSGLPLGAAIAAMALPLLADGGNWRAALLAQAAAGIVGGLLFAGLHRDQHGAAVNTGGPRTGMLALIGLLYRYGALWPVMLAGVAMVTLQYTFATHVLTFLASRFKLSLLSAAMLFSVTQWVGIAGRLGLAWLSDRWWPGRRMRSLAYTMGICCAATAGLILLPATAPLWMLAALFVVLGVFGIGWYPLYLLQVAEMAPRSAMAATISFSMTLNMVAISIMPPLFGFVVDRAGYTPAWLMLDVLLLAALALLVRGARNAETAQSLA